MPNLYENIYDQYINHLKLLELQGLNPNDAIEKHHIVPKHTGIASDDIVLCESKNHTLAHFYRYLTYKQRGALICYQMRTNQINASDRSLLAIEKNKFLGNLFWNPEWQKKQGAKGGKKGGKMNSQRQQIARQKIGLKYGVLNGIKNQTMPLTKMLSKTTIWHYKIKKTTVLCITILPQKSFSDLINILQKNTPGNVVINKSSFYKVIHGQRLQMYGWQFFLIKL